VIGAWAQCWLHAKIAVYYV